jgi:hypothetical protein
MPPTLESRRARRVGRGREGYELVMMIPESSELGNGVERADGVFSYS